MTHILSIANNCLPAVLSAVTKRDRRIEQPRKMVRSSLALSTVTVLLALLTFPPFTTAVSRLQSDATITEYGYFYSFYEAQNDQQTYLDTVPGGRFSMHWCEGSENTVGGVGWAKGSTNRRINFTITQFDVHEGQKQTVSIYGWMRDPGLPLSGVVEYYVVEFHHNWDASEAGAQLLGTAIVDNNIYDYFEATRVNSSQAFSRDRITFKQHWAVRKEFPGPRPMKLRLSGTVDMRAHFDHWGNFDMPDKPVHGYQILAVEGFKAQGYAQGYAREV